MAVDAAVRAELARTLLTAGHAVDRAVASALRGTELGVAHYLVLSYLDERDAATTSDLGRIALVPPATLTRVIDKLVDHALVHRTLDGADRRRILVRLTARGRDRARECRALVDEAIAEALPALRDWETQALTELLCVEDPRSD
ncbi:MarR family winged helix-turn-helix transcriptional regulator [Leucobacter luti]|uniref:MarR family winged helix-turn-helix transcriptional regulator n=1 Tax=Leucobacter luti TaxID=340320 RepID=UPI003CFE5159